MDRLRIAATAHGLNYLPQYLADDAGMFARRGLEVTVVARQPWSGALDDLASDAADIVLGGLWVPAMYAGMGRDLVAVGQLNDRFPMAVVTRQSVNGFSWSWLGGQTVLVPGQDGTAPYEFTAGLIREAGEDPSATRFVRDVSNEMLNELFEHGLGDAFVTDLVTAVSLQHRGIGAISCQHADIGGKMPNSVYYVKRDRVNELRELLCRFLSAIQEAMHGLVSITASDLLGLATKEWPTIDEAVLCGATEKLLHNGTWNSVRINPSGYSRWMSMLHGAGLIKEPVPYGSLVDTGAVDMIGLPEDSSITSDIGRNSI